jgi:hypothetical protein
MAFTTDQYNTLTEAIAQGATRVKYADKEIEYSSLTDMLRLKRVMEIDLGITAGNTRKYAQFTKGLWDNTEIHHDDDFLL